MKVIQHPDGRVEIQVDETVTAEQAAFAKALLANSSNGHELKIPAFPQVSAKTKADVAQAISAVAEQGKLPLDLPEPKAKPKKRNQKRWGRQNLSDIQGCVLRRMRILAELDEVSISRNRVLEIGELDDAAWHMDLDTDQVSTALNALKDKVLIDRVEGHWGTWYLTERGMYCTIGQRNHEINKWEYDK